MNDRNQDAAARAAQPTTLAALRARYDGFLLDAYGVLLDKTRALPGAIELLQRLDRDGIPWIVVTNAASRLPETLSIGFQSFGLPVPPERILTSGTLLADPAAAGPLRGQRALVIGPAESRVYAERAGARVAPISEDAEAEVLIIADQQDLCWPSDLDQALSFMLRRLDAGRPLRLLLCNPDLIYPVGTGQFAFTAGALAALFEAVLHERYPGIALGFQRLGKPGAELFRAAQRRLGVTRPVMLGDQLRTDIAGAAAAGIDSVLVGTGLAASQPLADQAFQPTWQLADLTDEQRHPVGDAAEPATRSVIGIPN